MAAVSGIKLKNWGKYAQLINAGKFHKRLVKHMGKALARSGKVAERAIRKQIQGKKLVKNAALTVAIKGANNPLVDGSELFKAITSKQLAWNKVFAGILREGVWAGKKFNIAKMLHEGRDIPVTKKMRNLFYVLWLASLDAKDGGGRLKGGASGRAAELFAKFQDWKPLRASTVMIRIPARPFVKQAMDDPRLQTSIREGWEGALKRVFSARAK